MQGVRRVRGSTQHTGHNFHLLRGAWRVAGRWEAGRWLLHCTVPGARLLCRMHCWARGPSVLRRLCFQVCNPQTGVLTNCFVLLGREVLDGRMFGQTIWRLVSLCGGGPSFHHVCVCQPSKETHAQGHGTFSLCACIALSLFCGSITQQGAAYRLRDGLPLVPSVPVFPACLTRSPKRGGWLGWV